MSSRPRAARSAGLDAAGQLPQPADFAVVPLDRLAALDEAERGRVTGLASAAPVPASSVDGRRTVNLHDARLHKGGCSGRSDRSLSWPRREQVLLSPDNRAKVGP